MTDFTTIPAPPVEPAPRPPLDIDANGLAVLRKALEWATDQHAAAERGEFSEWNQSNWCGTSHCLAGHIALLEGWRHEDVRSRGRQLADVTRGSEHSTAEVVAAEALGMRIQRCGCGCGDPLVFDRGLFAAGNDIGDLWTIANGITGGAIEIPGDLR